MRICCIYWHTSSVGGIATHLNTLRLGAMRCGDTWDIFHSQNWKTKQPCVLPERKWVRGGDTKIWVDGELPQTEEAARWVEENYDAVVFGFICPHETKAYPSPDFLPLYDIRLPKVAWVMDGYWAEYEHWARPLLPKLKAILCPLASYASPLSEAGVKNLVISAFPFAPRPGRVLPKDEAPLLVWPNQWKNIKGVTEFLGCVPDLPEEMNVELYSSGIRYYQLRTEDVWTRAVKDDRFAWYDGEGRAVYFGNVDVPEIAAAYQRAWFTVNLQGMKTKKDTYRRGSYNNTEVEALWYGACPVLHASTKKTDLPPDVYLTVESADQIPGAVRMAMKDGFALDERRRRKAREFVLGKHYYVQRYRDVKEALL